MSFQKIQSFLAKATHELTVAIQEVRRARLYPYEIAGWIKKDDKRNDILVFRVTATDKYISHLSVSDIYHQEDLLSQFSPKEIKYISTLAVCLATKTSVEYDVIWKNFREDRVHDHVHLYNPENARVIKLKLAELEKNLSVLTKLSAQDAFVLGKSAGVQERIKEEEAIRSLT